MDETRIRADIVEVGRRLYARGLIAANEGNVSVRGGDSLWVTPAGICKGFLTPEMIVRTDLEGRSRGEGRASTETAMHLAVYARRPDVQAVVHAHPPTATGFAVAGLPLDRPLIAEAVVVIGEVPVVPYGTPSTRGLAENIGQAICGAQALLMANHGAVTVGETVWRAWERMETLEQLAKVALVTRILGQHNVLPAADVARLEALRTSAGYPPPVCNLAASGAASCPVTDPGQVVLSREELVRLVTQAVERFGRG
jgi:L-fuculose-phosphate aldolase